MADSTTWNVEDFLRKLEKSLKESELNSTIGLDPDIDYPSSFSFDVWFNDTEQHHYWNKSVRNLWNSWIERIPSDPDDRQRDIGDTINSDAGFDLQQYIIRDPSEEAAMLLHLIDLIGPEMSFVSFNGKSFDIPLLQNRLVRPSILRPTASQPKWQHGWMNSNKRVNSSARAGI